MTSLVLLLTGSGKVHTFGDNCVFCNDSFPSITIWMTSLVDGIWQSTRFWREIILCFIMTFCLPSPSEWLVSFSCWQEVHHSFLSGHHADSLSSIPSPSEWTSLLVSCRQKVHPSFLFGHRADSLSSSITWMTSLVLPLTGYGKVHTFGIIFSRDLWDLFSNDSCLSSQSEWLLSFSRWQDSGKVHTFGRFFPAILEKCFIMTLAFRHHLNDFPRSPVDRIWQSTHFWDFFFPRDFWEVFYNDSCLSSSPEWLPSFSRWQDSGKVHTFGRFFYRDFWDVFSGTWWLNW